MSIALENEIGIQPNQVILPEQKNIMIQAIFDEIQRIKNDVKERQLTGAALETARRHQEDLQKILNIFLAKKGVITPDETNDALEKIENSKKSRLQKEFKLGLNKFTYIMIGVVLVTGIFLYYKKRKI